MHATWPKQNAEFWRTKIVGNQRRDRAVNRLLKKAGWRVVRIWEHALTKKHAPRTAKRLMRLLMPVPRTKSAVESMPSPASFRAR